MKFKINEPAGSHYFATPESIRDAFMARHIAESNIVHIEGSSPSQTVRDFLISQKFAPVLEKVRSARSPLSSSQSPTAATAKGPTKYAGVTLIGLALLLYTIAVVMGRHDRNSNIAPGCALFGGIAALGGFAALLIQFKDWAKATPVHSKSKFRNVAAVLMSDLVFAGILMILAGFCSLGMSSDPGNPTLLAVGALSLAWGSAALCVARHFGRARSSGLVLAWIFVIISGLFALSSLSGAFARESNRELLPLMYVFLFLIRGGLGCLLGFWAIRKLNKL